METSLSIKFCQLIPSGIFKFTRLHLSQIEIETVNAIGKSLGKIVIGKEKERGRETVKGTAKTAERAAAGAEARGKAIISVAVHLRHQATKENITGSIITKGTTLNSPNSILILRANNGQKMAPKILTQPKMIKQLQSWLILKINRNPGLI